MIHFNQPYAEVLIEQEVEAEQLEAVLTIVRIHFAPDTEEGVDDDVFDA